MGLTNFILNVFSQKTLAKLSLKDPSAETLHANHLHAMCLFINHHFMDDYSLIMYNCRYEVLYALTFLWEVMGDHYMVFNHLDVLIFFMVKVLPNLNMRVKWSMIPSKTDDYFQKN